MLRWLATLGIVALLVLDLSLGALPFSRRGTEAFARSDAPGARGAIGERLPALELVDLDGDPVRLADLRGHPTLVTFERSVDW